MNQTFKKNRVYVFALLLFVLSAIYGVIIRWNFVFPFESFNYRNFLQSHSHVAFLGWGYVAIVGLIIQFFISKERLYKKPYSVLLGVILITITLMLISFPLSGYKLFSIVLLCLFGITTYVLSFYLLKDLKEKSVAVKLIKYGIYYYLLSSLATWFLAWVLISQGKTNLYYNTVYFYLHFLYNGFFVFAIFGILFKLIEKRNISISLKHQKYFFMFLNIACIPTFALSVLWSQDNIIFNGIGFIGGFLQLLSLLFLLNIVQSKFRELKQKLLIKTLFVFGLLAYSLKIIIQLFSAIPYFVKQSIALKPFLIIGYLHLFTLAFMSVFIFYFLFELKKLKWNNILGKTGVSLFLIGVIVTEFLLFFQGFSLMARIAPINNFQKLMLIFSFSMVLGLLMILLNQFKNKSSN